MTRLRFVCVLASAMSLASTPALADIIFADSTFNLANYTETAQFTFEASIAASQCASCGNPGTALQFVATFGDTTSANGAADQGFINNTFSYNPKNQGALGSLTASVDKNLGINVTTPANNPFGNTFRPLIEQDGNIYLAAIPGPTLLGGFTGFNSLSQSGLVATDFQKYDFSTGTFLTGAPDFSGDLMLFGLGQITGIGGYPSSQVTAVYDNLRFDLVIAAPEPSSFWLLAGIVAVTAGAQAARLRHQRT
jgi:hypothetical protein